MSLSNSQKKYLKGLAHALRPVIMTGNKGINTAVIQEFAGALDHHELVKVKLGSDDRDARATQIEELAKATGADVVQSIGKVACFYRRNAEQPKLALPK
ncbi:MAG: ribosome assembly RNA-binding protein YhbY [Rudaea sp.]